MAGRDRGHGGSGGGGTVLMQGNCLGDSEFTSELVSQMRGPSVFCLTCDQMVGIQGIYRRGFLFVGAGRGGEFGTRTCDACSVCTFISSRHGDIHFDNFLFHHHVLDNAGMGAGRRAPPLR